jgi:hypothetical protein
VTEKQVTLSINRLDDRIRLTFDAAGLQMEAATPSVVWKVSVNTSSGQSKTITENRSENPLLLKRRSEAPLKLDTPLVIEAAISDRRCKQTVVHTIPALQYNQMMEAGGSLLL